MKTDVLVVGAGPVGLTMATDLARFGLSVRIVEKAAQATDKSKALVLWSRTLELINRMNCVDSFIEQGMKATGANITTGDKLIAHVSLADVASPYPYALMIPQSETERVMAEHLHSLGVTVERRVELVSFSNSEDGVTSTIRHADGTEESVESSWVVGCDGAHSTVRHQLGMEFVGDTMLSDWVLADVHMSNVPNPGDINTMWHAKGVLAIFPINKDRFRVIADVGEGTGVLRADPTLEEIQTLLDQRGPGGITVSDPIWLAAFRINERKVAEYRSGRVFLAGDSAHIHSPAGGQGMNTGMQDAFNLAWKLALVTRNECAETLLESFSLERSAVGEMVLKSAGRLTTIATLRGGIKQAIRNQMASLVFGFAPARHVMADMLSEVSIGYPDSPLSIQGGKVPDGPLAGQRAPLHMGENESPVGAGATPRFVLFAESDDQATALMAKYPSLLEPALRSPFQPGGLWLVRPDGYIAVATTQGDWARVATFFETLSAN